MRLKNHINHVYKYDKAVEDAENKKSEKLIMSINASTGMREKANGDL